ncbi:MAG: HlyD family efflux transporter periplasmic adaptor subunit [Anaerolineae bacterium]|nr:HlyD family efflux transporter periplasmic adaptor subunit [Anaerolineae bacterium]
MDTYTRILKKTMLWVASLSLVFTLVSCQGQAAPTPTPTLAAVQPASGPVAEGSVVPVQYATLSFVAPGIVAEILAHEGEEVKQGEIIARLKGQERLEAAVAQAEAERIAAQQALDDLYENHPSALAAAELRLAQAEKALDDARKRLEWKSYRRASDWSIQTAEAEYILAQDAVKKAEEVYNGFSNLAEDDVNRAYALTVLSDARKRLDKALANLNYLKDLPDEFEKNVAQGNYDVALKEVEAAKRDLEKIKNGPDPDALALAEARLKNAENALAAAKAALEDIKLIAPFDGVIVENNLKVGEQAAPGTSRVILADFSEFEVETSDLTELNIVKVAVGLPVTVTFDAIPDLEISGSVKKIQALGKNVQGDITYKVTIALDQQDERLRWNMTATVTFEQ